MSKAVNRTYLHTLSPETMLFPYVEGIPQVFSASGEIYSQERFRERSKQRPGRGSKDAIMPVKPDLVPLAAKADPSDDTLLLALRWRLRLHERPRSRAIFVGFLCSPVPKQT